MTLHVNLLWKILIPRSRLDDRVRSLFFNETGGGKFVRSLGGDFRLGRPPVTWTPTDLLHNALEAVQLELQVDGNRFPVEFFSKALRRRIRANVRLRQHDQILCATVSLDKFELSSDLDWNEVQNLRDEATLWPLVRKVLAIAITGRRDSPLPLEPQVLAAMHIEAADGDAPQWKSRLVGLVTGHGGVSEDIAREVFRKNSEHQVDETRLLIDKQGIAAYVPFGSSLSASRANLLRFEHAASMLELAAVLRRQLRAGAELARELRFAISEPKKAFSGSVSGGLAWSLFVLEFSLAVWLGTTPSPAPTSSSLAAEANTPNALSVLISTVTTVESTEVKQALEAVTGRPSRPIKRGGYTYQSYGTFGDFEIYQQISGMGSGGIDGSQETVRRGIESLKPSAVLMIGIAFGTDSSTQPIGTVLISKQIQGYELQRVNADATITPRGDKVTASPMLLNWVAHAELSWPSDSVAVKKGLILSGEKLIDNEDYRKSLQKNAPEAIGGEMEGAGLYVACRALNTDWLLIKSVCDWADGNKSEEKAERQRTAANTSAQFLVHLLKSNSESLN